MYDFEWKKPNNSLPWMASPISTVSQSWGDNLSFNTRHTYYSFHWMAAPVVLNTAPLRQLTLDGSFHGDILSFNTRHPYDSLPWLAAPMATSYRLTHGTPTLAYPGWQLPLRPLIICTTQSTLMTAYPGWQLTWRQLIIKHKAPL